MKNFWKSLVLATGVIALSGAAMAADVVKPPPAPAKPIIVVPKVYDWNGHYIGIQGGWDTNSLATKFGPTTYRSTASGGIAGIYGGFNIVAGGNWLWGVDASINWDGARATTSTPATPAFSAGPTWKGFVRGRLGWTADTLLIYATGGAAVMNYQVKAGFGNGSATPWGWTAGLGVDWALTDNLIGRLDWAYQSFSTFNVKGSGAFGGAGVPVTDKANTITVGLAWKL